jgi:hypothetical protein
VPGGSGPFSEEPLASTKASLPVSRDSPNSPQCMLTDRSFTALAGGASLDG